MNNGRNFFNGAGLDEIPENNSMNSFDNQGMMGNTGFNNMSQQNSMNSFDNSNMMNSSPQPMDMSMMGNDMGMNNSNSFIDMSQAVNMNNQGTMNTGFTDMSQPSSMNSFDNQGMMGGNPQPMDMPVMNQNVGMNNTGFTDMNNQGMMNTEFADMSQPSSMNSFDNQGMMGNTGFNNMSQQVPMNSFDNSNMMNSNPQSMDMPMMNQNMGMNTGVGSQPMNTPMMNPGMGMPQQNIVQPISGNAPKGKFNFAENKGGIIIAVVSVAVIAVLLVLFVFHKTLTCSADIEDTSMGLLFDGLSEYGVEITMESKTDFWFGKPTSSAIIMTVDLSDYDEDATGQDKDDFKESLIEALGDDYDIKEKGDKITMSMVADKDDLEDSDTEYDELEEEMEDMGLTCK